MIPSGKEVSRLVVLGSCCAGKGIEAPLEELERVRLEGVEVVEEVGVVLILLLAGAVKASDAACSFSIGVLCGGPRTSAIDIGSFTCTIHTVESEEYLISRYENEGP